MNGPKLIETWADLAECLSETHTLEIDVRMCNGWIRSKNTNENDNDYYKNNHYLSTHTFYGNNYKDSTELLQKCGFNVQLANWDK